jgi:hypothetical protein
MIAHIIHDRNRKDRFEVLLRELSTQGISYILWDAVKDITPGTGISKAHKNIVAWAKQNHQPEVLIMEDDVRFCGPGSFDYFLKNKPDEFDLYLAGIYYGQLSPENTVKTFSALHCYIIHERFYDTFLSVPIKYQLDTYLSEQNGLYKVCHPFAAIQHNGYSDNVKKKVDYDALLKPYQLYNDFPLCPLLKSQPGIMEPGQKPLLKQETNLKSL